ncbi:MAG: arsenic resistance N-acetyltransferase ArsN2 [Pseudomonadota bacterium]
MRPPNSTHLPAIADLLAANGLPTDDLEQLDLSWFLVREAHGHIEVVGGLERCGETALIRSVATAPTRRGRGLAGTLVEALELAASQHGLKELYLLTETAEGFFARLGYVTRARDEVPDAIRTSRQFSSLCPASATVMCKRLVSKA